MSWLIPISFSLPIMEVNVPLALGKTAVITVRCRKENTHASKEVFGPFVVAGPGVQAGAYCDVPVVQWDLLATLHDLSGNETPLPDDIDGGSLKDVFFKETRESDSCCTGYYSSLSQSLSRYRSVRSE
ncbi:MAG: hypothetical protein CM15mP130_2050 [Verrucomicrobiota bacterium]|nr:MAG: hypothetical protein CM15mP130_2050 [Verrucomicrobiota bacterium]